IPRSSFFGTLSPDEQKLAESYRDFFGWYVAILSIGMAAFAFWLCRSCWRLSSVTVLSRTAFVLGGASIVLAILNPLLPRGGGFMSGFGIACAYMFDAGVFWFAISALIHRSLLLRAMRSAAPAATHAQHAGAMVVAPVEPIRASR